MNKSNLITEKLEQLIKLAELEGEPNVQIVLNVLMGTRYSGDDGMFANKVQEYVRDVLIPKVQSDKNAKIASNN